MWGLHRAGLDACVCCEDVIVFHLLKIGLGFGCLFQALLRADLWHLLSAAPGCNVEVLRIVVAVFAVMGCGLRWSVHHPGSNSAHWSVGYLRPVFAMASQSVFSSTAAGICIVL